MVRKTNKKNKTKRRKTYNKHGGSASSSSNNNPRPLKRRDPFKIQNPEQEGNNDKELPIEEAAELSRELTVEYVMPPEYNKFDPYNKNLDKGTIILRLETHGGVRSCFIINEGFTSEPLPVIDGITYLQTITVGTTGCVNMTTPTQHEKIMEHMIKETKLIKDNDDLRANFGEICKGMAGIYESSKDSVCKKPGHTNSKYDFYKYEYPGSRSRTNKDYTFNFKNYKQRCDKKELCMGIFVIGYNNGEKNRNIGTNHKDGFNRHIFNIPIKYFIPRRTTNAEAEMNGEGKYNIKLSQLIEFLKEKGYDKIFIFDDSCNVKTYETPSTSIMNFGEQI